MDVSRRQLLALVAASAAVLALPDMAEAAPVSPFDDDDTRVLRLVLATVLGPDGPRTDAVDALPATLALLAPDKQDLVAKLPALLAQGSRFLVPTFAAWSALGEAARVRALEDWAGSPLALRRQIYTSLRQVLLFHAFSDPASWAACGYPGPWLGRIDLPRRPLRFGPPS
jgi:hypothetical protein